MSNSSSIRSQTSFRGRNPTPSSPTVSVLINAYNGERFIGEAIESVLAQTYDDYEIVVFDDASTDRTGEIANSFGAKVRYFRSATQLPLGAARNRGMELCHGRFISFLDQDDLYLPKKLELQIPEFDDPAVGLVFSNSMRFWENSDQTDPSHKSRPIDGEAFAALVRSNYLSLPSVVIRKSALPEERAWWFPESFKMCEEADLFVRLAYKHRLKYVDAVLAKYRMHESNFSNLQRELVAMERRQILERLDRVVPDFRRRFAPERAFALAHICREEARQFWRKGDTTRACEAYRRSLAEDFKPVFALESLLCRIVPFPAYTKLRRVIRRPL